MDQDIQEFVLQLNKEAMNYLKEGEFALAVKTLKDAQYVLNNQPGPLNLKLLGITLNNFGCFYKRIHKPNVALKYLAKAVEKESVEPVDKVNLAGTLLNICAIFSELGKHQQGLSHSCRALALLQDVDCLSQNCLTTMIIAYHNTGVEYEFLANVRAAVECYKNAWRLALERLGEEHGLTVSMQKSYLDALEKLDKAEVRTVVREQRRTLGGICSSHKSNSLGLPVIVKRGRNRKEKEKAKQRNGKNGDVGGLDEVAGDLEHVRFLTGERLQPMHPIKEQTGKIKITDDFPKPSSKLHQIKNINPRITNRCRTRHISRTSGLKPASSIETSHITTRNCQKAQNEETFYNLDESTQLEDPDYSQISKKKPKNTENLKKNFNQTQKNPNLRTASAPLNINFKDYPKPISIETNPLDQKPKFQVKKLEKFNLSPKLSENLPESNFDWMKKKENIEKFEALEEFINIEDELALDSSPIIEDLGNLSFDNIKLEKTPKKNSLNITKAIFKGYLKRKIELDKIKSVILIQKNIRMYQCRSIFKEIKKAIVFIQSVYRGYSIRKKLLN